MRKDPTEFRKRFAAWKNGKKPYENGRISDELYVETMEKVARDNWQQWGDESEDASLTRILNDNSYDYRGYYNKYPKGVGNAQNHWTDEFKTVWHPTFSIESKYSGKKSQYNPYGYPGGTWQGEFFTPLWYQQNPNAPGFYKDGYPRIPKYKDGKQPYKAGLPKYEDGLIDDSFYKKLKSDELAFDGQSVYLGYVEKGFSEEKALDLVKRLYKKYPNQYNIYAGSLPEIVIKPPKDNAVYKVNYMIPNKNLRNLFYNTINQDNDFDKYYDTRLYINRLWDLYLKSQKPTIKSTRSANNVIYPLFEKLKGNDADRAHYNAFSNTMYVSPKETASDIIAELAHAYQHYGTDVSRKMGWIDEFTSLPGDVIINGLSGYERPGNYEHTAHSIIEPMFDYYLKNNDVTYGDIRMLILDMYNNKDFYFKHPTIYLSR